MTPVVAVKPRGKQLSKLAPVNAQQRLIQLWLHDKPVSTQKCYLRYAAQFTAFLGGVGKAITHTTVEDLVEFSEYLYQKKLAAPTINTYMAAVKSLLSFAYKTGYIKQNPGAAIKLKKIDQRLHEKILTETDIALMIRLTERAKYRYQAQQIRDLLILKLLYVAGLRVSELVGLRWRDFTVRDRSGQITVVGKGDKSRHVLLPEYLWVELMNYRKDAPKDAYVFPSRKGKGLKPLQRQNVDPIIKDAAQRAGLTEKVSCHWLRHSHATHNAERRTPVPLIQQTLGHADIATTSGYIHIRPGDSSALHLPQV
ncbi:tyrosine-type recombinase/integrase [Calothrix sp. FACHB-1219]|uniref:tyrosine-type recombinase/integrase n=1 Tax=unclassified Calothrix TaxID=2619626 RepID=UPI0016831E11|nr:MULTISPECIES: tyrosine-type recombinase/integrase [unclassified Calothrix]MBD2207824.1 tyrosine-type recombinase/integrase [Calothrix sp. FACHB-168]MBD2222440.1 tyrosine-type recombinase/integrase [Calothrix sp. FACHB-1219]